MENSSFVVRNISELKPHPRNDYFFDPIEGDRWVEFVESVKLHGVINPIVVTPDGTIISGHMRVEACQALGIEKIKCYVLDVGPEDQEIALIESNIRQRGIVYGASVKTGRIIKALEAYNSKKQVREKLNIDRMTFSRAKRLAELPEDVQEAVDMEVIPQRTALEVLNKLTPEQQVEIVKHNELTQRERKVYEDLQAEKKSKKSLISEYERRIESIESLLENVSDGAADLASVMEERDEYQQNAESAQRDADLMLVCSLVETVLNGLAEVSNDPTPLFGVLSDRAEKDIGLLKATLDKILHRMETVSGAA